MINLTPHALDHPIQISSEEYDALIHRTQQGWSMSTSRNECLAKLHYLREGVRAGKIDEAAFQEREKSLVLQWWKLGL